MKKANSKAQSGVRNAKKANNVQNNQNGQNKNCGKSSPENCD